MSTPPETPRIYHITHVDNLASIIQDGGMISDAAMIARGGPAAPIGMSSIKERRLRLPVECHPGDHVGDYVPFSFCPRSIMLYVIHCANHPELSYRGGQGTIVHLEADLREVVSWADSVGRRWAFTLSNAGAVYTQFRATLDALHEVDWDAVAAADFRSSAVKEGKQAEFLVHDTFPWELVRSIGVRSPEIMKRAGEVLQQASHRPRLVMQPQWYF